MPRFKNSAGKVGKFQSGYKKKKDRGRGRASRLVVVNKP